jgi:hypothetical protein
VCRPSRVRSSERNTGKGQAGGREGMEGGRVGGWVSGRKRGRRERWQGLIYVSIKESTGGYRVLQMTDTITDTITDTAPPAHSELSRLISCTRGQPSNVCCCWRTATRAAGSTSVRAARLIGSGRRGCGGVLLPTNADAPKGTAKIANRPRACSAGKLPAPRPQVRRERRERKEVCLPVSPAGCP